MPPALPCGPVAQLGARLNGIEEVVGSNPTRSTKTVPDQPPVDGGPRWIRPNTTTPTKASIRLLWPMTVNTSRDKRSAPALS